MKQIVFKFMAAFMACIVVLTTMSFTVDMHFCGTTMVDFSFIQQTKSCGMDKVLNTADCKFPLISKKSCCSDTQLTVKGQDELKNSWDSTTFVSQVFVASFLYSYTLLFDVKDTLVLPKPDYRQTWVLQDLYLLHQSFII
ncbi:hypothetical protein ACE939_03745 [Aquimarina sp. W85]|uniref:HYC_CC_PP family protein n=1 Tax=Aquimarina rhodophyticola TaxID=3342246 RepID=UPI0036707B53